MFPSESGWCNRLALAGCGLALLHATLESLGAGYVLPAAACDLQLDTKQKGYVSAAAFLGRYRRCGHHSSYLSDCS